LSRKKADLVFSALLLLLAVSMVWTARDWAFRARLFPWTIGIPAIALALLQMVFAVRNVLRFSGEVAAASDSGPVAPSASHSASSGRGSGQAAGQVDGAPEPDRAVVASAVEGAFGAGSEATEGDELPPEVVWRRTFGMSAWIMLFAVTVVLLGFKVSAGLATLAFLRFAAREKWKTTLLISLGTFLLFYLAFDYALNIPFPPGWIPEALGLQSFDSYLTDPVIRLVGGR
jgi:hypothetical protein